MVLRIFDCDLCVIAVLDCVCFISDISERVSIRFVIGRIH